MWQFQDFLYVVIDNFRFTAVSIFKNGLRAIITSAEKGKASTHRLIFGRNNSRKYVNFVMGGIELLSIASVNCPQNFDQSIDKPSNFEITSLGNFVARVSTKS